MTTSRTYSVAAAVGALTLASAVVSMFHPPSQAEAATRVQATAPAAPAAHSAYGWPIKPFDRQHPVRGFFGDPRISNHGRSRQFHFGIDISAPNRDAGVCHAQRDDLYPLAALYDGLDRRRQRRRVQLLARRPDRSQRTARRLPTGRSSGTSRSPTVTSISPSPRTRTRPMPSPATATAPARGAYVVPRHPPAVRHRGEPRTRRASICSGATRSTYPGERVSSTSAPSSLLSREIEF